MLEILKQKKLKLDSLSNREVAILIATFVVPICLYLVILIIGMVGEGSQQFSLLANSFLHGHTYFLHTIGGVGQDPVNYHGKVYWDEGAFPALPLMPFVAIFNVFHLFFYQGYIKWFFVLGLAYFVYKIAKHFKYDTQDSVFLVLTFSLASVYIGVASVSSGWLYAQTVGAFLMFWALFEYFNKRRWWLISLVCSFVVLTRISAAPIVLFFVLAILWSKESKQIKIKQFLMISVFMLLTISIIGSYNYMRFGNPLNNGNKYQLLSNDSAEARSIGLFSLNHIPTNLYTAVLRGPDTILRDSTSWSLKPPYIVNNPLGMSIVLTSPYLLYLFSTRWSKYPREAKFLIISAFFSALLVLSYFGDGSDQFGYRYSLDFLPQLFVAFLIIYRQNNKKISRGMKSLILLTILFDFYMTCSFISS